MLLPNNTRPPYRTLGKAVVKTVRFQLQFKQHQLIISPLLRKFASPNLIRQKMARFGKILQKYWNSNASLWFLAMGHHCIYPYLPDAPSSVSPSNAFTNIDASYLSLAGQKLLSLSSASLEKKSFYYARISKESSNIPL